MIVAFYSFKGGAGRSMALVNVGEVLCRAGLRILLVDFDLEAPSLETYYSDRNEAILDAPGVLDLVASFQRTIASPGPLFQGASAALPLEGIQASMVEVRRESGGGSICLISGGRRAGPQMRRYVSAVNALDWKDLYDHWEGELYFRFLRQQLDAQADVTLVDCPSGITETGRICCGQVADAVVLLCAPSVQHMSGCEMMVKWLLDPRLAAVREDPLKAIVFPSRTEALEFSLVQDFRARFAATFEPFLPSEISAHEIWHGEIPFVPYYSFGNRIAVREETPGDPKSLAAAYERLTAFLCRLAPRGSRLFAASERTEDSNR